MAQRTVERLSYFSLYPADYLLDTGDLTLEQHGAYCLLMFRYYWEGHLKQHDVYKGCRTDGERAAADFVLTRFFHRDGDRYTHNRIERELGSISEFVQQQSRKGKLSAAARAERKAAKKLNGEPFALPSWIDAQKWAAWIKIRPAKARTDEAQAAAVSKLEKMRAAGHDPNAIVENSLANGWQGLFAPDGRRGAARHTLNEQNRAAAEEFASRGKGET